MDIRAASESVARIIFQMPSLWRAWKCGVAAVGMVVIAIILEWSRISFGFLLLETFGKSPKLPFTLTITGGIAFSLVLFIKWVREGWPALKTHAKKHILDTLIPTAAAVLLVFLYSAIYDTPKQIRHDYAEIGRPDMSSFAPAGVRSWPENHPHLYPRAHLHITKFEWHIPADPGGHAEIKVIFENNGTAPTLKMLSIDHAGFYPFTTEDQKQELIAEKEVYIHEPAPTPEQLEVSDNEIPAGVDRSITIRSSPWTRSAIDAFRGAKAFVYVSGTITYRDAHAIHRTKFCGFTGVDGNMKFCQKHNQEP